MTEDIEETTKYKKRKGNTSDSSKRSDHKHIYEKSILAYESEYSDEPYAYVWCEHCKICGRRGKSNLFSTRDLVRPEYQSEKYIPWGYMFLPFKEILSKFPDIPVYVTDPMDWFHGKKDRLVRL